MHCSDCLGSLSLSLILSLSLSISALSFLLVSHVLPFTLSFLFCLSHASFILTLYTVTCQSIFICLSLSSLHCYCTVQLLLSVAVCPILTYVYSIYMSVCLPACHVFVSLSYTDVCSISSSSSYDICHMSTVTLLYIDLSFSVAISKSLCPHSIMLVIHISLSQSISLS